MTKSELRPLKSTTCTKSNIGGEGSAYKMQTSSGYKEDNNTEGNWTP